VQKISIPKIGDEMLVIQNDPYGKIKLGGKPKIVSKNPLIYSGDSVNYIDPRSNQNYYAEDLYSNFEQNAKTKRSDPGWEGTPYNPFSGT
jgi:hypothetical protein